MPGVALGEGLAGAALVGLGLGDCRRRSPRVTAIRSGNVIRYRMSRDPSAVILEAIARSFAQLAKRE